MPFILIRCLQILERTGNTMFTAFRDAPIMPVTIISRWTNHPMVAGIMGFYDYTNMR